MLSVLDLSQGSGPLRLLGSGGFPAVSQYHGGESGGKPLGRAHERYPHPGGRSCYGLPACAPRSVSSGLKRVNRCQKAGSAHGDSDKIIGVIRSAFLARSSEVDCPMQDRLGKQNMDIDTVVEKIQQFTVETPSWGYGDSGTRFKVFHWPGAARTLREKLADAAQVQKVTGICPGVAIHIPWDREDDWQAVREYAGQLGLRIGAVNPNLFQDDAYRLGSLCHSDKGVREMAIEHVLECVQIAQEVGSAVISLWLADGTNYPGQDDLRRRRHRLLDSRRAIYAALPAGMRLLIEYKFFEPGFYSTDLPDWGTSLLMAQKLGSQAEVLVDTGHHPQGTNIAQIVAQLLDEGRR